MKKIFIANNVYSLLLILLKTSVNENIFIFSKNDFSKNIIVELKKRAEVVTLYEPKNAILKLINYYMYLKFKLHKYKKMNVEINMSCDHRMIGQYFLKNKKKYILYEEGLAIYNSGKVKNSKLKKIIGFNTGIFGKNNNVKKIYLTKLASIPKEIIDKVEIINLKKLWNKKTLEEQNEILNIFSFDLNIKEKIKGRDIILFTQPLSEDGIVTEERKIELYSKIIKRYPRERMLIKVHPREKTNYKLFFKECLVIDGLFPFEILNLLDVPFKKSVTIFSTAALGLNKDIVIDFYGTEIDEKIFKIFGNLDKIKKRNSFLEEK